MEKNGIKSESIHKPNKYYVYGIYKSDDLVYVGYTKDLKQRHKEHVRFSNNKKLNQLVFESIYKLDMRVIAIFYDSDLAKEFESILINRYKETLYNIKDEAHRLPIEQSVV